GWHRKASRRARQVEPGPAWRKGVRPQPGEGAGAPRRRRAAAAADGNRGECDERRRRQSCPKYFSHFHTAAYGRWRRRVQVAPRTVRPVRAGGEDPAMVAYD